MKIRSIKKVKPRMVYALKTSTSTFIADGLAHHNCYGCNVMHQGRQYQFGKEIDLLYGSGTADKLHKLSKTPHQFTTQELEEIIADSKEQIRFYEESISAQ